MCHTLNALKIVLPHSFSRNEAAFGSLSVYSVFDVLVRAASLDATWCRNVFTLSLMPCLFFKIPSCPSNSTALPSHLWRALHSFLIIIIIIIDIFYIGISDYVLYLATFNCNDEHFSYFLPMMLHWCPLCLGNLQQLESAVFWGGWFVFVFVLFFYSVRITMLTSQSLSCLIEQFIANQIMYSSRESVACMCFMELFEATHVCSDVLIVSACEISDFLVIVPIIFTYYFVTLSLHEMLLLSLDQHLVNSSSLLISVCSAICLLIEGRTMYTPPYSRKLDRFYIEFSLLTSVPNCCSTYTLHVAYSSVWCTWDFQYLLSNNNYNWLYVHDSHTWY